MECQLFTYLVLLLTFCARTPEQRVERPNVILISVDTLRSDRLPAYVIRFGNFTSPLLWDVTSVAAYLTASTIYLYLPLIPDIGILRDRMPSRRWLYRPLALGWSGSPRQQRILNRAIAVMAVIVIPIAVSVHTVVSARAADRARRFRPRRSSGENGPRR